MNITKTIENDKLTIEIEGRLDTSTSPELEKELAESLDSVSDLTFDFTNLDYVSSSGLRVLLATQKAINLKGGKMVVRNSNDEIKEVFEITGFDQILTLE